MQAVSSLPIIWSIFCWSIFSASRTWGNSTRWHGPFRSTFKARHFSSSIENWLGVFAPELPESEAIAAEIVRLIQNAVKMAEPYFDWRAEQAVRASKLNVVNKTKDLFERFSFFADQYDAKRAEAERRADERVETRRDNGYDIYFPTFGLRREAKWLALSAIESFFSWTEHVFILLAILRGNVVTGDAVAKLAAQNWDVKFKAALDVNDPETKRYYDDLIIVRRQLRNFVAHR